MGRATHIALISRHNERAARVRWIGTDACGLLAMGRLSVVISRCRPASPAECDNMPNLVRDPAAARG